MVVSVWTVAVVLALAGLWLGWRGAVGRRIAAHACPTCAYDRRGTAGLVCPECGSAVDAGRASRRVRRWWLASVGLAACVPVGVLAMPETASRLIARLLPSRVLVVDRGFGAARVRLYEPFQIPDRLEDVLSRLRFRVATGWERRVEITREGRPIYTRADRAIELGCSPSGGGAAIGLGEDLDGDGTGDLILSCYSGGAHCCWTYAIIRLGGSPALAAELPAENGADFRRVTRADGGVETIVTTVDTVWNYWNTCYACSPKPEVVLRYSRGTLALAPDLMLKPLPTATELAARTAQAREVIAGLHGRLIDDGTRVAFERSTVWRTPLELLYTGHEAEAWKFLDDAWPGSVPGKDEFLRALGENLDQSPYWKHLREALATPRN